MATKAFADGPAAIVRMEHSAHSDGRMKLMGVWNVQDVDWTLQAVTEDLMDALKGTDDAAPGASDSVVNKRAREQSKGRISQITAPSGHEIQVDAPMVFTVVMKAAEVEKARVTAYLGAGPKRT